MFRVLTDSVWGKTFLTGLICALPFVGGCGPEKIPGLVQVKGTVTYEGLALPWASVRFTPADGERGARIAAGMTDEDGEFVLATLGRKGCLPGNYVVTVEKFIADEEGALEAWEEARASGSYKEPRPSNGFANTDGEQEGQEEKTEALKPAFKVVSVIPLKYAEKETTELSVVIPDDGNKKLKIELIKE